MKAHANNYVPPRRRFLRTLFGAAAGYTTPFLLDLDRIAAFAQTAPDYKAMVCLFLYGGNDSHNMIVPITGPAGLTYADYAAARTQLALTQASLLPVTSQNLPGQTFGFHPAMPELQSLFNQKKCAVVANVGNLIQPLTKAQYQSGGVRPPQLFSHSDQTTAWQTSLPNQPPATGWSGRVADMVRAMNSNSTVSTSISLSGTNLMQRGRFVVPQSISTGGTRAVQQYSPTASPQTAVGGAIQSMLLQPRRDLFDDYFMDTLTKSVDLNQVMATLPNLATTFPNTGIGNQLKMIARIIAARNSLGMKRQIFFCSMVGFDTHSGEIAAHATLYQQISQSVSAFYNASVEMGIPDKCALFTASDFGRTLSQNGGGTDHGWGSHHLVVGGSLNYGQNIVGTFPPATFGASNPQDIGQGRLLPTTSIDQFAATLAYWFGVQAGDLPTVFPNLPNFTAQGWVLPLF
jgi:uncharacterized protein (DUF1501 family)